jgi:plastocyanin
MSFRSIAVTAVAGLLTLSACGGGTGSSSNTVPADAGLVVTAIEGINWDAKTYTATAGDVKVAAVNQSSLPHNLRIVDASGAQLPAGFNIASRGDIRTQTVALKAGMYTLVCTVPGHNNMKATLTVK